MPHFTELTIFLGKKTAGIDWGFVTLQTFYPNNKLKKQISRPLSVIVTVIVLVISALIKRHMPLIVFMFPD